MVGTSVLGANTQQHQTRCFSVNAVDGRQLAQAQFTLELHQQALLHIAATGRDGHEMRLVSDHHMRILKQHLRFEGQLGLVAHIAVIKHAAVGCVSLFGRDGLAVGVEHLRLCHAVLPLVTAHRRQAFGQKIQHRGPRARWQGHATGANAIAHRQVRGSVQSRHGAARGVSAC